MAAPVVAVLTVVTVAVAVVQVAVVVMVVAVVVVTMVVLFSPPSPSLRGTTAAYASVYRASRVHHLQTRSVPN